MTRFLLLSQFFPPETGAGANRISALADALRASHSVTVLTLKPSYPSQDIFDQIDWVQSDRRRGYSVVRSFHFRPHSKSLYRRAFSELLLALRLGSSALSCRFEVLIVTTPSMFLGPIAHFIGRLKRAKVVWDVRDLTWRYVDETVRRNSLTSFLGALIERLMKYSLNRVDLVVGATQGISELLLLEHNVPSTKLITIPNGVSEDFIRAFEGTRYPSVTPVQVVYVGLIGYNQGISVIVDVARQLPQVNFIVIGDGSKRDHVAAKIDAVDIKNITLRSYVVDRSEIKEIYKESHILFGQIIDRPTLNRTALSSKLMEYMATGKPMVYAGKGLAVEFLSSIGSAEIAVPENPDSIAKAIQRLIEDPERAAEMGRNGRKFLMTNFIREELMQQYVREIESRLL